MIRRWIDILELEGWDIVSMSIDRQSVVYDDECPNEDRYFVGIMSSRDSMSATIFHDRPLTEEDVVHELLHVKYPDWSEDQVNIETQKILRHE